MQTQDATTTTTRNLELPSFSVIFETENLSSVELENIYRSLDSLASQDISPEQANEFLIIDSGDAPAEVIAEICSTYSWIQVHPAPHIGYYEAKMLGASLVTGDVVVYCDSDCVYSPNWLRNLLTTVAQHPTVNIVAGETTTPVRTVYELAIALHYFFPRLTHQAEPYLTGGYFLNNVAFRRDFLLENPIPTPLPLYRGNCDVHHHFLQHFRQEVILRHPQSQAMHEPPTPSFAVWRYLLRGRDRVLRARIKASLTPNSNLTTIPAIAPLPFTPRGRVLGILATLLSVKPFNGNQIRAVFRDNKRHLILFPFAVPILLWFELLFLLGSVITHLRPNLVLDLYNATNGVVEKALPTANSTNPEYVLTSVGCKTNVANYERSKNPRCL